MPCAADHIDELTHWRDTSPGALSTLLDFLKRTSKEGGTGSAHVVLVTSDYSTLRWLKESK